MRVRDAMVADVVSVAPADSLAAAARVMRDMDTGFLPVVDGTRTVGAITDRDIVVRFVADAGTDPADVSVAEVMTTSVRSIGPDEDLAAAGSAMRDAAVRRLMVIEDGALVGVLSHGALVQATDCEGGGRQATLGVTEGA